MKPFSRLIQYVLKRAEQGDEEAMVIILSFVVEKPVVTNSSKADTSYAGTKAVPNDIEEERAGSLKQVAADLNALREITERISKSLAFGI